MSSRRRAFTSFKTRQFVRLGERKDQDTYCCLQERFEGRGASVWRRLHDDVQFSL